MGRGNGEGGEGEKRLEGASTKPIFGRGMRFRRIYSTDPEFLGYFRLSLPGQTTRAASAHQGFREAFKPGGRRMPMS